MEVERCKENTDVIQRKSDRMIDRKLVVTPRIKRIPCINIPKRSREAMLA